ncbi:diacylglycerol/lipid kinase family protein [Anaerococcus provencensis]|uniref:diacylglycerol/lipid kinase family protein n=1 Tax=Anaerococcus provencensis TaxID=938293 RepID=UPI000306140F|nr:diacylglycerol kinase family protein [Anaerococcus provencensis]
MTKLFLISSTAGATEYYFSKKQIEDIYKKYGREDEIIVKETRYRGHLEEIVRSFLASSYKDKLIICLGGDGTINEVVNICLGHDVAVGLIPTGTGNDFAKNFDYENFKIADTFDISIRPIDLIKVNGKYCVNVTSLGFDTEVLKTAYDYLDKDKSLGKRAYIKAVGDRVKNLTYQDLYINLTLANDTTIDLSDEFLISAICNGGYYGSGFNPAPDAKIDDGIINFVTARKFPKWQLLPLILKYKQGKHQSSKYLDEYLIKSGQIKSAKDFLSNIDGEIFSTNSLDFEIKVNAINWAYFEK